MASTSDDFQTHDSNGKSIPLVEQLKTALMARGVGKDKIDLAVRLRSHLMQFEGKNRIELEDILRDRRLVDLKLLEKVLQDVKGRSASLHVDIPIGVCKRLCIKVEGGVEAGILVVQAARPLREADRTYLIELVRERGIACHAVKEIAGNQAEILSHINSESVDPTRLGNNISALNSDSLGVSLPSLISEVIHEAVELSASDIHVCQKTGAIENYIAYRVAGTLQTKHILTENAARALMGVLKQLSGMDATNKINPQDGRMSVSYQKRNIDVRSAVAPLFSGNEGETAVLRILDPQNLKPLTELFREHPEVLKRLLKLTAFETKPGAGLVLITGAVASGKSTTLYSEVVSIDRERYRVRSIEDPIEQQIPGVHQVQVNEGAGMSYPAGLKAFLRADPDVIVVGETRDEETLGLIVRAVETGHLVMSTLHTASVSGTFDRIRTLLPSTDRSAGMLTVSTSIKMIMNQRLEKRMCSCAQPIIAGQHPAKHLAEFAVEQGFEKLVIAMKQGCPSCGGTGYTNQRVQVPEVLVVPENEDIRSDIFRLWSGSDSVLPDTRAITRLKGVFYYSRQDAVRTLLEAKLMDLSRAHELLGDQRA